MRRDATTPATWVESRTAIEALGDPVVVVSHSYSGIPVTEGGCFERN
jgi:hypothetical protein